MYLRVCRIAAPDAVQRPRGLAIRKGLGGRIYAEPLPVGMMLFSMTAEQCR